MYIEDIGRLSFLIPVLYFLFKKKLNEKTVQVIFYYTAFYIIQEVVYYTIKFYFSSYWGYVFNLLFVPVEFLLITSFFKQVYNSERFKGFITIIRPVFIIFWLVNSLISSAEVFNSLTITVESLIILFFSILYFYDQMQFPKHAFIYTQPAFWGVIGFFIFTAGTFFVFLYRQSSIGIDGFIDQYIFIHVALLITRNIFFLIAMLIKPVSSTIPDVT